MKTRYRLLGSLLVLGLIAGACGGSDDDSSGDSGGSGGGDSAAAVTIALGSEPTSLDPYLIDDGSERAVNDNIYETLLTRSPEGELQPGLATELPTQIDDLTWQFKLQEGVKFHDGSDFNADSVVASIDRMVGLIAESKTDNDGFYGTLSGATKVDDYTVDITTSEPDGVLPARMYWLKQIPASAADSEDMSEEPSGTGPYEFVSYTTGSDIQLERFDGYWGDAPSVENVTYEFASEGGTRLAGLKSGKYDLITNLPPQDVEQAPKAETILGQEQPIIILDTDEGITADENVRKALNLAVDKDAIAETVFGGFAVLSNGQLISPSILGHNEDLEPYAYDPEEAKSMLEAAGVAGETITLVGESGRWLNDRELLEAIAGYWKAAGLTVDLQILDFDTYLDVLFDPESRADSIYVSSSNDILDADRQLSTYYHMDGTGASNSNTDLAALVDQGRAETDPTARAELYAQAVETAYDGAYFVFLVNNEDIYGLSERLEWTPRVDGKILVKEMTISA